MRTWLGLPSRVLNYSITLHNKSFKEVLSLRMPYLFRNASFVSKEEMLFLHSTFSLSSYCDMNTSYYSQYRSYNKGIPSYLHDRPREFVLHCLERRKIALGSDLSGITCQRKVLFSVMSFTNNLSECYKVYFGNEHEMPKCSCYDWCKTGYLCKHFFAVFLKNFHHDHSIHYHRYTLTVVS